MEVEGILHYPYNHVRFYPQYEPPHDKTNKMAFAPSEDAHQSGHPPSLIRVFTVRMKKAWVIGLDSYSRQVFIYMDPILIYISL